ncbi:permease [Massilia glaciei]|uniref:Permease n=1 Tax=Massilia glaciei TaxID=1524097 RepID=A0A2U2HI77_9BURK|nr:permease [Massilia glaciei]PWF46056.1 permease [Massilia glaciei]
MQRALSLDRSPALGAVLRYFACTPLFALLAGLLLVWQGEAAFQSRWSPVTLALTHLFTLGVLGMSMAGALIQILPVVACSVLPHARTMAPAVHALLGAGTLALAAAFLASRPWLFGLALAALVPALLWLAGALAIGLWQRAPAGAAPMVATVRLALASLLVTVVLGTLLGMAFALPGVIPLDLARVTDLHAMWGLFGWGGLLLAGVAVQVLPMFQVTPLYDSRLERWLGSLVVLALLLCSVKALGLAPAIVLLSAFALFAVATLLLLKRRTRAADAMTKFWSLAMVCLLAAIVIWALPGEMAGAGQTLAVAVLFIAGFLYSTINGMLYKIVPFLLWHHKQTETAPGQRVMQVKRIIPDEVAQRQFYLHVIAVSLLVAACWYPEALARAAGVAISVSALSLGWNLSRACRRDLAQPAGV